MRLRGVRCTWCRLIAGATAALAGTRRLQSCIATVCSSFVARWRACPHERGREPDACNNMTSICSCRTGKQPKRHLSVRA